MKQIFTLFFVFLFLIVPTKSKDNNENLFIQFINNPYDDKEVILSGFYSGRSRYCCSVVSLTSDSTRDFDIELGRNADLLDVAIHTDSKKIAFATDSGNCIIYNYNTTEKITSFSLNIFNQFHSSIAFSSDGSKIYISDNKLLGVDKYDIQSGEPTGDQFRITSTIEYSKLFINSYKDEVAFLTGDSLEFYSLTTNNLLRKIYTNSDIQNLTFRNNGELMLYNTKEEIFLRNVLDGDTLFFNSFDDLQYQDDEIELTSDNKYLIFPWRISPSESSIYDIDNDEWLFNDNIMSSQIKGKIYYVTPDLNNALVSNLHHRFCFQSGDPYYVFYTYDLQNEEIIVSAPRGFIHNPSGAVIDDESKTFALYNSGYYRDTTIALVTSEKEFIKYIHVKDIPKSFVDGNNYLAFIDSNNLKLYNTSEEEFEYEIATGMNDSSQVDYIDKNGGRIIISRPELIKIYSFPEMELSHEIDLKSELLEAEDLVVSLDGRISFYYEGKIIHIDAYSGILEEKALQNIPEEYSYEDITNDGRYLLFSKEKSKTIVYDTEEDKLIFPYDAEDIGTGATVYKRGFLGNYQIIWYYYQRNPVDKITYFKTYDLVTGEKKVLTYEIGPSISKKGDLFVIYSCDNDYKINEIREPISSVEEDIEQANIAYPNPTDGIINLKPNEYKSNISIYDAFGNKVYSSNPVDINSSYEIDISHLSDGIYFLLVDNKVQKIIKK